MAQIVTITNPLTGQPVQVDQLEHTAQQIDDIVNASGIESIDYPGCYYRMVNGVVEWFNPPMLLGDEYRTQERYLGKPVYRKLIWGGPLPNSGYTSASIASGCIIIQAVCYTTTAASASGVTPSTISDVIPWNNNDDNGINMSAFKNFVSLWCKINRSSSNFVAYLWYIKNTD